MKRIYLDHAAATPTDPRVQKAMEPFWSVAYGNPGAIHAEGVAARRAVDDARKKLATELGVHADEIIFTGSATESCNLALVGAVRAWRKAHPHDSVAPHIIVSAVEHDAVLEAARMLEADGVRVTRLPVDSEGIVDIDALKAELTTETVLVSVMYANNEIGTIQPIKEIARIIRKWKKEVRGVTRDGAPLGDARYPLLHTDACQAANYCDMSIPSLGVDLLTINSAKVYGPKGAGLLFVARHTPLLPTIVGGGQERGLRGGTENVPAIVGFAEAFGVAREMVDAESQRLTAIRDHAIAELQKIEGVIINGSLTLRLPNNINFSIESRKSDSFSEVRPPRAEVEPQSDFRNSKPTNIDHEFLAIALDAQGFAVATKSACNESDAETSHVLAALRGSEEGDLPQSGLRLSLGRTTSLRDIDAFITALRVILSTMIVPIPAVD